jgi:hypothetical protein
MEVVTVDGVEALETALSKMSPWPGMPEGTRAIVTRLVDKTETYETTECLGYLRIGVSCFPITMLFDIHGIATGKTFKPGDFIDSYESFTRLGYKLIWRPEKGTIN